ncbi:MAG: 30S ribosomal protein S2 [Planctomycetes bacterium]|nr:30S ribosomal protein S2 [Planctomycetota bacterium]
MSVEELIKAGVHFGHRTSRWNPKMKPYIFKRRNLIHIIDLRETIRGLVTAKKVTAAIAEKGEYVLFVGTKHQARPIVKREAQRCGMPYVTERWPGGLLTNYVTIRQRLERLEELEELERTGEIQNYSKKMISSFRREKRKIERNLGGVREMDRLPGLVVMVDPERENIAVRECVKLEIPTIAWIDTNGDPEDIDVVVPANDDAIGSIEIFVSRMADSVLEGRERAELPLEVPEKIEEVPEPEQKEAPEDEQEPEEEKETEEEPETEQKSEEDPEAEEAEAESTEEIVSEAEEGAEETTQ